MHQHGGVEHGVALVRSEPRMGDAAQVGVERVEQAVERPPVAVTGTAEQYGDVSHAIEYSPNP